MPKSGDQGNYTFVLTAVNTQGAKIATELSVLIPNRASELITDYAEQHLGIFNKLSYAVHGHFTDADGDVLTYEITKPKWIAYDAATKTLSGDPPNVFYRYQVAITALDGHGGKAHARLNIHVDPTDVSLSSVQQLQLAFSGLTGLGLLTLASVFLAKRHCKRVLPLYNVENIA